MKDLIDRTKTIVRRAGITELAFTRLSKRYSRNSFLLAWIIIAMTATVGGSYFSPYEFTEPLIVPAIALGAALLGIMARISRVSLRSTEYRIAAVQFSRLRWEGDFLLVQLRGGDLSRAEALSKLEKIDSALCDLIAKINPLPDRLLRRSGKRFDRRNPEFRYTEDFNDSSEFIRAAPRTGAGRQR